jgi:hypothetical protein
MRTVYKYPLTGPGFADGIELPMGAQVLDAQYQGGKIVLWALVDTYESTERRLFIVTGTGHSLNYGEGLVHVSTVQDGGLVWHVFEIREP